MVDAVRQQGRGFVRYQWAKPGQSEPVDKISYVQGFEPWGWVIGTGSAFSEVSLEVTTLLTQAKRNLKR